MPALLQQLEQHFQTMNKKPSNKNQKRSLSRLMAVQIFYQRDFFSGAKNLEEITKDVIENYALDSEEKISSYREKIDEEFLQKLLQLSQSENAVNSEISEFLQKGWSLENIDGVLLQILRLGIFELKFFRDIPAKAIISEYVDIAASFFDEKKITFVNAVLDAAAKKIGDR